MAAVDSLFLRAGHGVYGGREDVSGNGKVSAYSDKTALFRLLHHVPAARRTA